MLLRQGQVLLPHYLTIEFVCGFQLFFPFDMTHLRFYLKEHKKDFNYTNNTFLILVFILTDLQIAITKHTELKGLWFKKAERDSDMLDHT